ncbi:Uncharacterised protein [Vibrio cholerae]|nr:Uncharacterised protein [Vibrio cholerae]
MQPIELFLQRSHFIVQRNNMGNANPRFDR